MTFALSSNSILLLLSQHLIANQSIVFLFILVLAIYLVWNPELCLKTCPLLCRGVETLEVLAVFMFAYLSYIIADLVGWSGIISLIGESYISLVSNLPHW